VEGRTPGGGGGGRGVSVDTPSPPVGPVASPAPPQVSRRIRGVAWAVVACTVPSNLWRAALVAGVPVGYDDAALRANLDLPGWQGAAYVLGLVAVTQGLALLALGLVRPWGEVVPRWVPLVGGRPVPVRAAVVPALAGAVVLTLLWVPVAVLWWVVDNDLDGTAHLVAGLCYVPLAAWGPLLAVLALDHRRRRQRRVDTTVWAMSPHPG
jgi:hypothetical protein